MSRVDSKILVVTRSSHHRFAGGAVAEALELEQCATATVLGVVAGDEVVATEIVVAGVGGQDVPGRDEQAVGDRGLGAFAPPADGDASEQRVGVGVLRADGAHRGGAEGGLEPAVAGAGAGGFAFASGLVIAGADASAGCKVGGGGEAAHIGADLGEDDLGVRVSTPGMESSSSTAGR